MPAIELTYLNGPDVERLALVVPYGTMSAVELSLTDVVDTIVVDDWGQCRTGPFGALP